jgi:nucleotide-binding universal stress UspA family protein
MAKQFNAQVTAIFAVFVPDPRNFYVMAGSAEYYADCALNHARRTAEIERLFNSERNRAEVAGRWIVAPEQDDLAVSRYGRCADLIIAAQDDPGDPQSFVGEHFIERLVMTCGRPVLLIPYAGDFHAIGDQVMVAWDGSREAARAVHDALPFLKRAKFVTIVTVNEASNRPLVDETSSQAIASTLAQHGVTVTTKALNGVHEHSIGDILLSYVSQLGADLLVMGAYGHNRWQELVLGGATRSVLRSATVPVLLSY